MIRIIIWFNALLNSDAIQNKMKRQVVKNLSLFILFIDNIQGCGNMDEEIYIDDIYELKDLLGNNFDKCLEGIDKDSDISKYFSEEYLKNYFSKKDENNEDADIDLYVYNLMDELDFRYTCEDNIGAYIDDEFEIADDLPDEILMELSDKYGYYQNYLKYKDKYYPDTIEYMEDLKNKKDNIGESTFLTYKIDYGNREYPFVYVAGKIYKGKSMETHTQLVERVFLKEKPNDDDIVRLDNDEMEKDVGSDVFAFGHMCQGMAFIDDNLFHCTKEDVAKALINQTDAKKVYYYDDSDKKVTRLAKLKCMKGNI